jgi:hypothetical protein
VVRKAFTAVIVATGVTLGVQGLAVGAGAQCRTVYANGSDTSNPPRSVVAHLCDRIRVNLVFGTQGQLVPDWSVARKPATRVAKFASKTYRSSDPTGATATQDFLFRAVGTGKTSVKFRETAPGNGQLDSYTLTITVLARRNSVDGGVTSGQDVELGAAMGRAGYQFVGA